VNSLSRIPPSLAELPLRQKTPLLLGLYEFLLRAVFTNFDQGGSKRQAHHLSSIFRNTLTFERFPLSVPLFQQCDHLIRLTCSEKEIFLL